MEDRFKLLDVLYDIVKDDPHPFLYHCSVREIVLRLQGSWEPSHLEDLEREQYILVKPSPVTLVLLTESGMEKAKGLRSRRITE